MSRLLALLLLAAAAAPLAACEKPCRDLEHKVCDVLKDARRCELMQDPWRRERLSDDACASILRSLDRR